MKLLITALSLMFAVSAAYAQDKKEPTAAQKKQQARMSACNKQATEKKLKGEERKSFMSSCLKS
jgi:type IV secretory pathway VirB9-like protein